MAGATEELTPGRRHHVVIQDLLSDARRRLDRLVRMSREVVTLIDASPHRDRAYQAAGRIIVGGPEELLHLRRDLDRIAYVADDLDRSVIRKELPSMLVDVLDDDLRRAFRAAALVLSEEATREYEGQDVFPTVGAFVDAMPESVRRMHVQEASRRRATRLSEITGRAEKELRERAEGLNVLLKKADAGKRRWTFEVRGGTTSHMVRLQASKAARIADLSGDDVRVSCDCGDWQWGGPEYQAKKRDYIEGRPRGTATQPVVRDPQERHHTCKHVLAVANLVSKRPLPFHLEGR